MIEVKVRVKDLRPGMWIKEGSGRFRVVEVSHAPLDHQTRVERDYGNGGEPAVDFYDTTGTLIRVVDI